MPEPKESFPGSSRAGMTRTVVVLCPVCFREAAFVGMSGSPNCFRCTACRFDFTDENKHEKKAKTASFFQ